MGPNGPVSMGSLPTSSCSLPRQQSQQTSISEGAGSRTGSIRARRVAAAAEQQQQESRGAIPRNSSIGSAATTSSSHGSAGGAGGGIGGRPGNPRPSRPPRLSAVPVIREVALPENRVDAGTSTADGIQSRLEEAKTPTDSTGSSESWFATLFRSASLR